MRMQFLTTVNVTAVKLFGTATRGEKIDLESYTFEGCKKYTFEGCKKYLRQKLIKQPNEEKSHKIGSCTHALCCVLKRDRSPPFVK